MRIFTYRNLASLVLILLNILVCLKLSFYASFLSGKNSLHDFDTYYRLVTDLRANFNPYTVSYMKTLGPPSVFIYYYPFSFLDLETGRSLTTVVSIASGVLTALILALKYFKKYSLLGFLGLNFMLFTSFPARFTIEMGQPNLLLTFLITIVYFSKSEGLRGLLSSFAILVKPFLVLTPISFLRTNKPLFLNILFFLIIGIVFSTLFIKLDYYLFYLKHNLSPIFYSPNFINGLDYYNQSYMATLARFGVIIQKNTLYSFLIPCAIYIIYKIRSFEIAVIFGLLFSFVSWQHYYVVLFPIFVHTSIRTGRLSVRTLILFSLFFFWWVEFPFLHDAPVNPYTGVLASHYFLSALLLSIYLFFLNRYEELKA